MYTSIDFTIQIVGWRGVPSPTNKGFSYTNLVWLGRDLKKIDYKNIQPKLA
jgi:hypothetical protein